MKLAKKKFKISRKSLVYIAASFAVVYALFVFVQLQSEISSKRQELDLLQQQIAEQQLKNEELNILLADGGDQYIRRKAREELDLVLPGERVYIVRSGS